MQGIDIDKQWRKKRTSEIFKTFGIFCFSFICFGLVTAIAGVVLSFGNDDSIFAIAWLAGAIIFSIAMAIEYG